MNRRQRILAVLLVAIAAAALTYVTGKYVFTALAVAAALAAASGRFQWSPLPGRRVIMLLLLTLLFALHYRYFTPLEQRASISLVGDIRWGVLAEYFLGLMAVLLYLKPEKKTPGSIAMLGLLVVMCSTLTLSRGDAVWHCEVFGLLYVAAAVLYGGVSRSEGAVRPVRLSGRWIVITVVLLSVLSAGLIGGRYCYRYEIELEELLSNMQLSSRRFWRAVGDKTGSVGFGDTARLSDISQIRQAGAEAVALQVFASEPPGYLRARAFDNYSFDHYSNAQWRSSARTRKIAPVTVPPKESGLPGESNVFVLRPFASQQWRLMDIWPKPQLEAGFFSVLGTALLEGPVATLEMDENDVLDADDLIGGVNYLVAAPAEVVFDPPAGQLRRVYLLVPAGLDQRIAQLAEDICSGCGENEPRRKMAAVTNYFYNNYSYHMGIEVPEGNDPLTYFLLEQPAAHCEYFAAGAAVLLRLTGVPTRYVTGFVVTEKNPYLDCWIARHKDAHAWVEAWDEEHQEWVLVEATPAQGVPTETAAGRWDYLVGAIKFYFQELRIALHREGIKGLLNWLVRRLGDGFAGLVTTPVGWAVMAVVMFFVARRLKRRMKGRSPKSADPAVRALQCMLRRMDRQVGSLGLMRVPTETLNQFADRIVSRRAGTDERFEQVARWYELYSRLRYSGRVWQGDLQELEDKISVVRG